VDTLTQYGISQVGMVVADLDATMQQYHATFGWGPWNIYEYRPPYLEHLTLRGKPAEFTWMGAEAHAGGTWIEVLQPLEGDSPLKDWLTQHGDGVHHLGYEAADEETARRFHKSFEDQGMTELVSAYINGMYFYYMDASPLLIEVWAGSADALTPARTYP
jgi:methylmalonyl-CoA/ethylmalonyl-CoA epimerase